MLITYEFMTTQVIINYENQYNYSVSFFNYILHILPLKMFNKFLHNTLFSKYSLKCFHTDKNIHHDYL